MPAKSLSGIGPADPARRGELMSPREQFDQLLLQGSTELHADNPTLMMSALPVPTPNVIDSSDLELFFASLDAGLITIHRGGKFNTLDRPKQGGRWSLLSRSKAGGWYNAEYLPQIAAYADLILRLGYPAARVLFELPAQSLQLDLAVLDDEGRVVVLGEAKRDVNMLEKLRVACLERFAGAAPGPETLKRGDEARQLAWRLWTVAPSYTWLIGPGERSAFQTSLGPLALVRLASLPAAEELQLAHEPPTSLLPPQLR